MNYPNDQKLAVEVFNNHPESIIFYSPLFTDDDESKPSDFQVLYCNEHAASLIGLSKEDLSGQKISSFANSDKDARTVMLQHVSEVYQTGKASESEYYNSSVKKYFNVLRSRVDNGVLSIGRDKTEEYLMHREKNQQAAFLQSILDSSINAFFALEAVRDEQGEICDFRFLKINKAFTKIIGKTAAEVEGQLYLKLFPSTRDAEVFAVNKRVIETGNPERFEFYYGADGFDAWFDISLAKWETDGLVISFSDITERKRSQVYQEEQTKLIQTMLNAAFHGKALLEPVFDDGEEIADFTIITTNNATEAQIGVKPSDAIGRRVTEILPEYKRMVGFELYKNALKTGTPQRAQQYYKDERIEGWFDIYVAPVGKRVVVSFSNITEQKQEAIRIQQQKNLLDAILKYSPSGISVTELIRDSNGKVVDGKTLIANEAAIRFVGIPEEAYLTKTAKEIDPGIMESHLYQMTLQTLETGKTFHTQYFIAPSKRWLELSVGKMDDNHLINVFTDVTDTKEVQLKIERFAETLQKYINTSQSAMSLMKPVLDESGNPTDFTFGITNTAWASYAGKAPEDIVNDPASKWFPSYMTNGLFDQYKKTYETGQTIRAETHYTGEGIDAWLDIMSTKTEDGVLVTISDLTGVKQLQIELEKSVEELKLSNANLEEFAYAASHDLQEPLRKITYFSNRLTESLAGSLSEENRRMFERMESAAQRMKKLINDLLTYSRAGSKPDNFKQVELSALVKQIIQDLEPSIIEKQAKISVAQLPGINGDAQQLTQMFQNLLSNALKYQKPNVGPEVNIEYRIIDENDSNYELLPSNCKGKFHEISVIDNGIGFEQEYAEKIFQVFQRLHGKAEYEGTGVGLAIVKKVVTNHRGHIFAQSELNKGAKFIIMFPVG